MTPEVSDTLPDELQRFVQAQRSVYHQALAELRRGRKTSHWMWFVFPQLRGLGSSAMAHTYGLASADEALGYWRHPLLGARLRESTESILALPGHSAHEIFGSPDDLKLRSCMTLFNTVCAGEALFDRALTRFFAGEPDGRTLQLLQDLPAPESRPVSCPTLQSQVPSRPEP